MTLLLFNYALFNDPILLVLGYCIMALEAITAVLQFFRVIFKNNPKMVKKIDKKINKYRKAIETLRERQAYYRAEIAYNSAQKIPENKTAPASYFVEEENDDPPASESADDAEIDEINKDAQKDFDEHERAEFDTSDDPEDVEIEDDTESYELYKKFVAQVKKNDK